MNEGKLNYNKLKCTTEKLKVVKILNGLVSERSCTRLGERRRDERDFEIL